MRQRLLEVQFIRFHKEYGLIDFPTYQLLLEVMLNCDFQIIQQGRRAFKIRPQFEKIFWRADSPFAFDMVDKFGKISADFIVHQGVHSMFTLKFGRRANTDPGLVLLAEAMATASSYYYQVGFSRLLKLSNSQVLFRMRLANEPTWIKEKFIKQYHITATKPAQMYHDLCRDIWETYKFVLFWKGHRNYNAIEFHREWLIFLKSLTHSWLPTYFDLTNNILFVRGLATNFQIQNSVNKADKWLEMFLKEGLEVDEVLSEFSSLPLRLK